MSKQLLIEDSGFVSQIKISKTLTESISVAEGKHNTLVVKNVPCTICNRLNQNGRNYSTKEMQKAIDAAQEAIRTKQLLCQADEHPEGSWVAPTHASHVVTRAYIKPNVELVVEGKKGTFDVLFMDWEVLNTQEGKNLQALLLSECSLGTSIRGLGDMDGDNVINYELLGVDVVNNPSSGTYTRMPVKESVTVELKPENALEEASKFTVSTYASNTTHDLQQAMDFQKDVSANVDYGTIVNMGTKMDQEVDPKTGVSKTIGEVEVETSDDMSELKQAIEVAIGAFTNPQGVNVTSVTIEKVEEDDDMKDSTACIEHPLTEEDEEMATEEGDMSELEAEEIDIPVDEVVDAEMIEPTEVTFDDAEYVEESVTLQEEATETFTDALAFIVAMEEDLKNGGEIVTGHVTMSEDGTEIDSIDSSVVVINSTEQNEEFPELTAKKVYSIDGDTLTCKKYFMNSKESLAREKELAQASQDEEIEETSIEGEVETDTDIEVNGDTVTTTVDTGSDTVEVEKEFPSEEDAQMAVSGVKTGKISPDVLMSDSADECEAKVCPHCGEKIDCCQEEDAVEEKLYAEPSEPSDAFVEEPIVENDGEIVIKLGDIDYDVDIQSFEEVEQETLDLVNDMPEEVEVVVKASEIPEDAEEYIIKKAREVTGLPIKAATVVDAWEKDTENIIEVA